MSPPHATAPGPGPYLQRLAARRDAYLANVRRPAKREQGSWLRRLLWPAAAPAAPPDPEPNRDLVTDIAELLHDYDPVGLIEMRAPWDEYAGEARSIASWMPWVQGEEEMHGVVFEVFYMAFHLDIPGEDPDEYEGGPAEVPATYLPIAHDLMAVRQRYLGRFGYPSGPPLFDE